LKVLLYNNIFQQYYGRCLLLSNSVKDMNFDRNVVFQFLPYNFKCIPSSMCYLHYSTEAYLLHEPYGFLPAPLSVTNIDGLKLDEAGGTFLGLPLFQRHSVHLANVSSDNPDCLPGLPYDFCCPTVKSYLTNRTCSICKLYFPSNAMEAQHKRQLHPRVKTSIAPRCRPVRITAKRQRDLMAIILAGTCLIIEIYIPLNISYRPNCSNYYTCYSLYVP